MDVDVTVETMIGRPVDVVAAYACDPGHAAKWYANIREVVWETAPAVAVGSRARFVARFLGRTLAYTYEIREHLPGQRLVMATREGPFPMETTYTWEPVGDRTRMRMRNRGAPEGFGGIASPFVALAMRRAMRKDLARLRQLLER